jgi:hypothetical protein
LIETKEVMISSQGKNRITKWAFTLIAMVCGINSYSQDKERGVNIGFVYPLSIQGVNSKEYTNIFSLHGLVGLSGGERGFTASGFGNMIIGNAGGFQAAGFFNFIGGNAHGFKAAGFMNTYRDGLGFQAAGFGNFSKSDITGMQVAGFINIADSVKGVQSAGFINIAGNVEGTQLAGYVNIAKKVKGVQLSGFINIADSSEYPIAPINIIKNGEKYLGVTTDENASTIVSFRSGSKKLYGIVGVGYNFKNKNEVIAIQYGLGAHFFARNPFRLNTEGTITHLQGAGHGKVTKTSISVLPAIKLGKIEIFGGPSLNFVNTTSKTDNDLVSNYLWQRTCNDDDYRLYGMYVGYVAGLHVAL